jgi:VanZ family protein
MRQNRKLLLPILALIFFTILFCLPGSALPKEDWLSDIWFDKWVHIGIFITLLWLWCRALKLERSSAYIIAIMVAVAYGLSIEIIQDRLVTNRSFDLGDLLADFIGSMLGVWLWVRYKKINPCRNRGRNQN